jgi:hypothetical protein
MTGPEREFEPEREFDPEREFGAVRDEAQRLVAAALAAASVAARGFVRSANPLAGIADAAERLLVGAGPGHVATGTPECCVCPVCKAIAALRDPDPRLAVKLAQGAADLATGLTEVLRTVGGIVSRPPAPRTGDGGTPADGAAPAGRARTAPDPDVTWRMATAADSRRDDARPGEMRHDPGPEDGDPGDDPWHAATTAGN